MGARTKRRAPGSSLRGGLLGRALLGAGLLGRGLLGGLLGASLLGARLRGLLGAGLLGRRLLHSLRTLANAHRELLCENRCRCPLLTSTRPRPSRHAAGSLAGSSRVPSRVTSSKFYAIFTHSYSLPIPTATRRFRSGQRLALTRSRRTNESGNTQNLW